MCTVDVLPGKPGFSFATQGSPHLPRVLHLDAAPPSSGFPHAQRTPGAHPCRAAGNSSLRLSPCLPLCMEGKRSP